MRGCRAYCTRWRKVTKVTNPISDFTFLSTAKSGKSRIKNPFLDSPKGTHPLSWLPFNDQLYYRQSFMAFKCMTGHAPENRTSQFITREKVSERTTRSSQKLNSSLFRTASGQRTFYYRTVKLWNNLEPFLKLSRSVQIFKRLLRNQLLVNFVNAS